MMIFNMWDLKGWGNRMIWFDWDRRRISGHLQTPPQIGDEVRAKMESGKIARFSVIEVRVELDPSDQFFATVSDIGYLEIEA